MKAFATLALAASAAAVEIERSEYIHAVDVLPDALVADPMPQGTGRDHTDWSWGLELEEQAGIVDKREDEVDGAVGGLDGAIGELEDVRSQIMSPTVEHQRNCQLHREEEINLYYQCTQNDINNYALHHFGGEKRSYPRWVEEYNVCIAHIHTAKTLHLDFYHEDGTVTLEPCDPQSATPSVYIEGEEHDDGTGGSIISPDPLDPTLPCDQQNLPNWSGIWVEIWGGAEEADAILAGEAQHTGTERCYTIQPTPVASEARLLETWDNPGSRDYTLTLRRDDSIVENGCMIHTHLRGTNYTQWVKSLGGEISFADQINEDWHHIEDDGSEKYLSSHHEIRVGSCRASDDESHTAEKHYTAGVMH